MRIHLNIEYIGLGGGNVKILNIHVLLCSKVYVSNARKAFSPSASGLEICLCLELHDSEIYFGCLFCIVSH